MTYREALQYINSFTDFEKLSSLRIEPFDLTRLERLLHVFGDPHLRGYTFHVAGTKGKGSTAAMLSSVLREQGYRTGFFTSPHLHSFRERIQIDGQPISEADLASLVERVQPFVERLHEDPSVGRITTFELTTLFAFLYFETEGAAHRVIEAGLGGRLDATNVVNPLVTVLTSISLDHTSILGSTLEAVAREKAGIIKPGGTVICAPQQPEARSVVRNKCRQQEARLIEVGTDVSWRRLDASLDGQLVQVHTDRRDYRLTLPLLGRFQCENAAIAVAAIEAAGGLGVDISPQNIAKGIKAVSWPGRMQVLQRAPLLIVDGAHNVHSAAALRETVNEDIPHSRCVLVIGTSVDKDIAGIARELAPLADRMIATRSRHPRSADPALLAREFASLGVQVLAVQQLSDAMSAAMNSVESNDLILVTGSLFVVAEALEWAGLAGPIDPPISAYPWDLTA